MKELIDKAKHIVIFTHMAPDGDAMGSALAIYHHVMDCYAARPSQSDCKTTNAVSPQAEPAVRQVTVIVPNAFPAFFNWMPGADKILVYEKNQTKCSEIIAGADLFICTDFNDPKRIGPMGEKMMANPCPKVLIDHHIKGQSDEVQGTKEWYVEEHVDTKASSACEIVYRLIAEDRFAQSGKTAAAPLKEASQETVVESALSTEIAMCIYTGLMTDTGNFSYNSSSPEIYEIIANLIRAGVQKDVIYDAVFNQYSTDRMRLTGYALYRKMRIYPEHHLALITLSADELDRYHYQQGDCEGLVNMPLQIADVRYSVFMREERPKPGTPKSRIRISFRSQGDRPVNKWASEVFHGGGHANASGGEIFGSIDQAVALFEKSYPLYVKKD